MRDSSPFLHGDLRFLVMTRRAAIQALEPCAAIQTFLHARGALSGTLGAVGTAAASRPAAVWGWGGARKGR